MIVLDILITLNLQAKINDRGVAAVAYNVLLRPGVTLGLGASFDTQKMDHSAHKVSLSKYRSCPLLKEDRLAQASPSTHRFNRGIKI